MVRVIWLIIAATLLLSHTSVLAKSYIRVCKKGVVYYYFVQEHRQPGQADMTPAAPPQVGSHPRTRGSFPAPLAYLHETDRSQNLWPSLIKAVNRMEAKRPPRVISSTGAPDLSQLRLGKANVQPGVNFFENMWTAPRYLGLLLSKIAGLSPLACAKPNPGSPQLDNQQTLPPIPETRALVREVCRNFLNYAQEQHLPYDQVPQGSARLPESNQFGYNFPVAYPYSFRDSWGDYRSGGRFHHAVDIFAGEGTPVYAVTTGIIKQLAYWESAGLSLFLQGQDGQGYGYMHLQGYAAGIIEGKAVKAGELIAYVGHTGIKQDGPHLHLQVYADHNFSRDNLVNPYPLLVQLCQGKGVTDLYQSKIARLPIPQTGDHNFGTVRLVRSMAPGRNGLPNPPRWLIHNF